MFKSVVVGVVSVMLISMLALCLSVSKADADEMTIGRMPDKTHLIVVDTKGTPVPDAMLPVGYHRLPDGGISTPRAFVISPDGKIFAPRGVSLEGYSRREQDGAILTPEGLAIKAVAIAREKPAAQLPSPPVSNRAEPQISSKPKEEKSDKPAPPRRGQEIQIPKSSKERKDLSFLEGCWVSEWITTTPWNSTNQFKAQKRLCFDRRGNGRLTVTTKHGDNHVFKSKARARFSGKRVVITTETACHSDGTCWSPEILEFEGSGSSTLAYSVAVSPYNSKEVRRTRYRLFRD